MIEQDQRILRNILKLLEKYKKEEIGLAYLVNALEGSLNAVNETLLKEFYDNWYNHWGQLETYLALDLENARKTAISNEVDTLLYGVKQILDESARR